MQELEAPLECRAVAPSAKLGRVDDPGIDEFLRRKYGWQKRLLDRFNGSDAGWATIEIVDA
ncbi:MAG: hypothetical protein ACJ74L_11800 [Gaiellaceae bacterium]